MKAPVFVQLLKKMQDSSHPFYPQLMIDGNGILHPRGMCFCFGSACHLRVLADLPTIGVGKNASHIKATNGSIILVIFIFLHHVDGLTNSRVRELLEAEDNFNVDFIPLVGDSGNTLGAALHSSKGSFKPIFVSVGHRVSLASAVEVVKRTCKYRVPEPIRQADIRSRDYLRKHH
ncbi:putative deoxyribonuclease V [Helianthus debilis subsp. tardiflorus]